MEKNKGLFSFRKHPVGNFLDEKKGRKRKGGRLHRSMGFLMAAALIFNTLPASGLAVSASEQEKGLCEHHPEHTAECGYAEAQPCTHEHGEKCYKTVTECVHEHTDECYPETEETEESAGEGNATASDAEGREPENCTHKCSEESGCITKVLDCHHEHDESCGYKEAQDCGYVCEICNGIKSEDTENTEDTDTDTAKCICEILCTEDSINGDCPVCGADDASFLDCKGKVPEENTENQEDTGICKHHQEHDADCGYIPKSEDGEGSPCTYECRICPIEDLIAALPDKVTEDNAEDVRAQLEEILALYRELPEDEQGQIDISRCLELQEALNETNAPMTLADGVTGNVELSTTKNIRFTADVCGENCGGHIITQNLTAISNPIIVVESGTHNITFHGLNIINTTVGVMSGATMNLTLEGSNTIKGTECGIYVPKGATLVITAENAGSLDVSGKYSAGIGGAFYDPNGDHGDIDCGTVIINGGNITATGGSGSAGIGGAAGDNTNDGKGGNITINGGKVVAKGGSDAPGIGGSTEASSDGLLTLSSANVLDSNTTLGSNNGTYYINSVPTADMISIPTDMHYTSADMAAEIAGKVTLSGGEEICGKTFQIDTKGWNLTVTKKSDLEYTASYTHTDKGTISKTVTILPCIHNNGAALTHHDRVEADCTHTGILEYWDCSICGKNFSDKDGKTEITDTKLPIAAHTLTHHDGVEADCTQTGVKEYWDCSVCGKKFSDKDGQTEITDINIPITAHTLTHHEGQEATCTAAGSREYWDCSVCGKKFSDQNGQTEIADADIVIPLKTHTLTYHARQEAGCLTAGTIEYWSCDVCSKLFADADGKKEVTDIKISAKGHDYGAWGSNGNGTHTHSCQRAGCDSTETENCSGGTATYTEKAKCTVCGVEYGELLKDAGAPTGEISIRTNHWNSFLHTITFGLFFKETEQVTITAQDNESGVASVSYYISDSELTEEDVKKLENWTAGNTDKTTFSISPDKSCVVYAKITDKQGNVTYISSDGLVFDGTFPSITGVTDGKTYCTSQEVTVTDNNSESVTVTVNGKEQTLSDSKFTLGAASGVQTIEAADKAGNITTVTVTVNAGHDYSTDWKSDGSSHWHECACGDKADAAPHIKDNGNVTKPATETETGIRTYQCSVCGYVMQEEMIDRLPPSHTHNYGTEWKSDAGSHWYECSCGNKSEPASHIEDGGSVTKAPTEKETGVMTFKCRVCGYVIRTADIDKLQPSHTHDYSTDWKSDESSHWHECICGDKTATAAHTEDSGSVTKAPTEKETGVMTYKCSVCGCIMRTEGIDVLPHTHSYGIEWKSDSSSHWHECICGDKSETAAHTEDGGSVTKPATVTETGIRTYKCRVCGYEMRTEIIGKLPQSHVHNYGTGWKSDHNNHWHECSCGDKSDSAAHTEDSGTVTKTPTKTEKGVRTYKCSVCGYVMRTADIARLPSDTGGSTGGASSSFGGGGAGGSGSMGSGSGGSGGGSTDTGQPFIKDSSGREGWDVIRAEAETAAAAPAGGTVDVDMNGAVSVPGSVFAAVRGKDVTLCFDMGSGITWSVDGKDVTAETAGDTDFSVTAGVGAIPEELLAGTAGGLTHLEISLAHEGAFGFTATLTLRIAGRDGNGTAIGGSGTAAEYTGMYANLFYYNPDHRSLEFVCAGQIREDGTADLPFMHASDYTVILSAYPMGGTDTPGEPQEPGETEKPQEPLKQAGVKSVKLSRTLYTYNGKPKKPSVTAVDTEGRKIPAEYYAVSYKNNMKAGKATVTVRFKDGYSGTVKKTFTIRPAGTSIQKLTASSGGFAVKWKKKTAQVSGYQVQYSTSAGFKGNSTRGVFVKKASVTKQTVKNLKAGKKYYVRIRTYKTVKADGKNTKVYSAWSGAVQVRTLPASGGEKTAYSARVRDFIAAGREDGRKREA